MKIKIKKHTDHKNSVKEYSLENFKNECKNTLKNFTNFKQEFEDYVKTLEFVVEKKDVTTGEVKSIRKSIGEYVKDSFSKKL